MAKKGEASAITFYDCAGGGESRCEHKIFGKMCFFFVERGKQSLWEPRWMKQLSVIVSLSSELEWWPSKQYPGRNFDSDLPLHLSQWRWFYQAKPAHFTFSQDRYHVEVSCSVESTTKHVDYTEVAPTINVTIQEFFANWVDFRKEGLLNWYKPVVGVKTSYCSI